MTNYLYEAINELNEAESNKLIAYNGSSKKFSKFSNNTKGETIGTSDFDIPGIYFSNNKEIAREYACGESSGAYTDETGKEHEFTRKNEKGYVYTCELNYNKPIVIDYKKKNSDSSWNKRINISKNISKYIKDGYDIVLLLNIPYTNPETNKINSYGNEYVVLNSDIITILDCEECITDND